MPKLGKIGAIIACFLNMHKIKAQLYDNALTEGPNDYTAKVVSERSLSVEDICQLATGRDGAGISAPAMARAVNLWQKEMACRLCDGFVISTGYFNAQPNIKGVFNSPTEAYNPDKHAVLFSFSQGSLLRKELAAVEVDITGVANPTVIISQVIDVKTGSVNELLTPSRNLKILGSKLKILGWSEANGVYFLNQESQAKIKVDASDIVTNNPSELIIIIPSLEAGAYKVGVTTQYSSGNSNKQLLKEPRTAVFEKILTVLKG
jgi:hypothetical protein